MARQHQPKQRALAAACLMALALAASGAASAQQDDLERKALETVAARLGVGTDALSVENIGAGAFELQKILFYGYKIVEKDSGKPHAVSFTDAGQEIGLDALTAREGDLYAARYGRMDVALADAVAASAPAVPIEVVLWLKPAREIALQRFAPDARPSEQEVDALFSELDAERSRIAKDSAATVLSRLAGESLRGEADALSPAIRVAIPARDVRRVSEWEGVIKAYRDDRFENQLDISHVSTGAVTVHATNNNGQGVRVGEIEVGGRADSANPFLTFAFQDPINSCYMNHGTQVGGVIRSVHSSHRGISRGVLLRIGGSCAGFESQLTAATSRAASWGARTFNLSFGRDSGRQLGTIESFYDDQVQNGWRTVVVAAGNSGQTTGNVLSPAIAYNVIAVGAFNDNNWPWQMAAFSSWRDPISQMGDRRKPEVSAPGVRIMTPSGTGMTPGLGVDGTSFAAPMVTGGTALLMNTNPALSVWPEAVKAIIMASATHDIDPTSNDRDGAGGVNLDRANRIAGHSTGTWGGQAYNCTSPIQSIVSNVFVNAGQRTRVVMAWNANPDAPMLSYKSKPGADLDMHILAPNNALIAASSSWDNSYEIVEFLAPMTGVYRLRVNRFTCDYTPKWLGWAWRVG